MRMVKQEAEVAAVRQAVEVTTAALNKVHKKFIRGAYSNEFEIELDLTSYFFENGGSGHSFEPIVASGDKACTIHPQDNHKPLIAGQPILLDVGAQVQHYAADISRSWCAEPSKRHSAVHAAVVGVADYAKGRLKPGVLLHEYEQDVEHIMGEKLR